MKRNGIMTGCFALFVAGVYWGTLGAGSVIAATAIPGKETADAVR